MKVKDIVELADNYTVFDICIKDNETVFFGEGIKVYENRYLDIPGRDSSLWNCDVIGVKPYMSMSEEKMVIMLRV